MTNNNNNELKDTLIMLEKMINALQKEIDELKRS